MVIACEHCNTRFQLDDARVPAGGVRVRCSRCKHAFFVSPPGGADEALHAAAAEAAAGAAPSAPPATEDLPPPTAEAPTEGPAPGARGDGDEEDWEFNIPESGAEARAAAAPAESSPESTPSEAEPAFGGGSGEIDFGDASDPGAGFELGGDASESPFDIGASAETEPAPDASAPPTAPGAAGAGDDLFGAADDASAQAEAPVESVDTDDGDWFGASDGDLGADEEAAESAVRETAESAPEGAERLSDLGSPDEWDFVGDAPPTVTATAPSGAVAAAAPEPPQQARESTQQGASVPALSAPVRPRDRWSRVLAAAGWIACGVLALVGASGVWIAGPASPVRTAPPAAIGALELRDLRAARVENLHAGPVWVFRGTLVNPGSQPARAGTPPRVALLDAEGEVVGEAWFRRTPEDARIRESAPAPRASRTASAELARRALGAGESVALHAIAARVPDAAVAWRVDAASPDAR